MKNRFQKSISTVVVVTMLLQAVLLTVQGRPLQAREREADTQPVVETTVATDGALAVLAEPSSSTLEEMERLVAAQRAYQEPEAVVEREVLPPGTLRAADAPGAPQQIFLPALQSAPLTELALHPDVWMEETAGWHFFQANGILLRYPDTAQVTGNRVTDTAAYLDVQSGSQTLTVEIQTHTQNTPPLAAELDAYARQGHAVRELTVKGLPAWQVTAASDAAPFCELVLISWPYKSFHFSLQAKERSSCADREPFRLMLSSLQFMMEQGSSVEDPLPLQSESMLPVPYAPEAVSYDRTAAYNYAVDWYDVFDNSDGYYYWSGVPQQSTPQDGAHFLAHIMQAGGLPIHHNVGHDDHTLGVHPYLYRIQDQRTYVLNTGWASESGTASNMEPGDMIYYRPSGNSTYCWGGAVTDVPGDNIPDVALHSYWDGTQWRAGIIGYNYDLFACGGAQVSNIVHSLVKIDTPFYLDSGLTLNPSAQLINEPVQASFTVASNSGTARSISLRVTTPEGNFATQSCTVSANNPCTYNQPRSFGTAGSFTACAQANDGSGWENISPGGGTTAACRTLSLLSAEDVQIRLDGELELNPYEVDHPGGPVQATFTVEHTDSSGAGQDLTERFRAHVTSGNTTFPATGDVTLSPGDTYTYDRTEDFSVPGIYEVIAEHRIAGNWLALLGLGSKLLRVWAITPEELGKRIGEACYTCGSYGDPVNTATGNYSYDFTDMSDPTPGLKLEVTRWYNSLKAPDIQGPFGYGSSWEYGTHIEWRPDKTAVIHHYDGHTSYFIGDINTNDPTDMSGVYENQGLDQITLERFDDGTSTMTRIEEQIVYEFDANGRLVRITDPFPATVDLSYQNGRLAQIAHSNGVVYSLHYNGDGYISQIDSSSGRSVNYTYTAAGDLAAMTRPDGTTYTYDYDGDHRLLEARDPNGHAYLHNVYDAEGRVIRQYLQGGETYEFDYGNDLTSTRVFVDPLGHETIHIYDADYRLLREEDELGYTILRTYDAEGNVLTRQDKNGNLWTYTYDDRRNRTSETDPLGNTETFSYDNRNNLTAHTDKLGRQWQYGYDANNRLTQVVDPVGNTRTYSYDSRGYRISETDETGATTFYAYNDLGFQTTITSPLGYVTHMEYDERGNQTRYVDAEGNEAVFIYDDLNRLVESVDPMGTHFTLTYDDMGNLLAETDGLGNVKTYTYDEHDRIVEETDFRGNATYYAYDALGRTTAITDSLGNATRMSYDARGQLVTRREADGGMTTMAYDAAGSLVAETGPLGRTTTYEYDALGRQVAIHRPCDVCAGGVATTLREYDAAGQLIREIDPRGAITEYQYDPLGRLAVMTDTQGATTFYTYDPAGRVIQEVGPRGDVTSYEYDAAGRLLTTTNPLGYQVVNSYDAVGNVTQVQDERGYTTTYVYDANDRVVEVIDPLGNSTATTYDANGNTLTTTDPLGRVTEYVYDANGNQVQMTDPRDYSSYTEYDVLNRSIREIDALGNVSERRYDAMGRVIAETNPANYTTHTSYDLAGRRTDETTPLGYTTVYTYDVADNLVARREANGGVWAYGYDEVGNQVWAANPLGHTTSTTYDLSGRPIAETDTLGAVTYSEYNLAGQMTAQTDPREHTTTYQYDLLGRQRVMTNALGYTQVITYDGAGNRVAVEDERGYVTTFVYDALNREIGQIDALGAAQYTLYDAAGQVAAETDYEDHVTGYRYDANGNRVETIDPLGHSTRVAYDKLNRPVANTDPLSRTARTGYTSLGQVARRTTPAGHTTVFEYDADGRQIARVDPLGSTWLTGYDSMGRVIAETDPLGRTTTNTYDPAGQLIAETDPLGRSKRLEYDPAGRLITLVGPDGTTQRYEYDSVGNRISVADGNGHLTQYQYDPLDRQVRKLDPLGNSWEYGYDAAGNQTTIWTPAGHVVGQQYDALGRRVSKTYDGEQEVAYTYSASGHRTAMDDRTGHTTYTYDARGRLLRSTDGYGKTVQYQYDAAGQLVELRYPEGETARYAYDDDGQLAAVTAPDGRVTTYERDALNRPVLVTQGNGATVETVYDAVGNTRRITQRGADGSLLTEHTYTVNEANQRTRIVETLPQGTITTDYVYDDLDRLVASVAGDGRETYYAFDDAGNRTRMWGTRLRAEQPESYEITYAYNAANQLQQAVDSVSGTTLYTYDADGRRTGMNGPNERHTYHYDAESHLVEAHVEQQRYGNWQHKNEVYEQYVYDGSGRRAQIVEKMAGFNATLATQTYRYDDRSGWDVLRIYEGGGAVADGTLFLNDQFLHKLAYWKQGESGYFLNDELNSVTGTTDESGQLASAEAMTYADYGQQTSELTLPTKDSYTGYESERYTGIYYARNRYYDSHTGTFLTKDPFPTTYSRLLDLHRYMYVRGDPVNRYDPLGLFSDDTSIPVTRSTESSSSTFSPTPSPSKAAGQSAKSQQQVANLTATYYGTSGSYKGERNAGGDLVGSDDLGGDTGGGDPGAPGNGSTDPDEDEPNTSINFNRNSSESKLFLWLLAFANSPVGHLLSQVELGVEFSPVDIYNMFKNLKRKTMFHKDLTPRPFKNLKALGKKFSLDIGYELSVGAEVSYDTVKKEAKLCVVGEARGELGVTFPFNAVVSIDIYGALSVSGNGCLKYNPREGFRLAFGVSAYGAFGVRAYAELDIGIAGGRVGVRGEARLVRDWNTDHRDSGWSVYLEAAPFYGYKYWGRDWEDYDIFTFTGELPISSG